MNLEHKNEGINNEKKFFNRIDCWIFDDWL